MSRHQNNLPLLFHVLKSISSKRSIDLKTLNQTRRGDQFHLFGKYQNINLRKSKRDHDLYHLRHFSVEAVPPILVKEDLGVDLLPHLTLVPLLLKDDQL